MPGSNWDAVAAAIAEGPLDEIGQGSTYSQESPRPRPDPFVAFDLRIPKTVTLVSGHHRAGHGKEQRKDYDFELCQITGTAAIIPPPPPISPPIPTHSPKNPSRYAKTGARRAGSLEE